MNCSNGLLLVSNGKTSWDLICAGSDDLCELDTCMNFMIYSITRPKKHFKNEQRSRDAAAKKRANTSGVGKINNYCEDIYIPPYNNTH